MKIRSLLVSLNCLCLAMLTHAAPTNSPVIFPGDTAGTLNLVWPATPGVRYEVRQSTNLQSWTTAPGYPAAAPGPAQQMPFSPTNRAGFFRVRELDEQPPVIVSQYPADGGFAVPRFSDLTMQLSDVTGIDTNSIQLTVGGLGTFTAASPQLIYSNNVLTFINGGSIPLGGWGSNIQATLIVADPLGNRGTNIWSFSLEVQPVVVGNLFVFGSPQAQRAGQRVGNIPTAALAGPSGPVPMGAGDGWTVAQVLSDRVVLSYPNTTPPITVGSYLANLTPVKTDEIFYRKATSLSDDAANKLLTVYTTDVPLAEILPEGSGSVSKSSMIYEVDANNVIIKAFAIDQQILFSSIGYNSSPTLYDQGGVTLRLSEAKFLLTPSLQLSFETHLFKLQRFNAVLHGRLETALVPELTVSGTLAGTKNFDLYSHKLLVFVGSIGPVPIWMDFNFSLGAEVGYNLAASATMSTGVRQNVDMSFGVDYVKGRSPSLTANPIINPDPIEIVPFDYEINGTASAHATLTPQIDLRVESLAGVYANVDPEVEINGQATVNNGQLTSASWGIVASADLNVGMSVVGLDSGDLPALPSVNLFRKEWSEVYPPPGQLSIQTQPQSVEAVVGSSATFSVNAVAGQAISYQWYFNGGPLPGNTGSSLTLNGVTLGAAGQYYVRLTSGGQTINSSTATLTVRTASTPSGMALIPAGSFTMGDNLDGYSSALPLHTVYVSAFYMDKYDVTEALWAQVYNWAIAHGYTFDFPGSVPGSAYSSYSKGPNNPVVIVDWYDCVKWCNARSEMEGRTPAYYTTAAQTTVYRTGQVNVDNSSVKWNSGYRLATEAEWEKAARGGLNGQRFPWGNTISWSQANYYSYWSGGTHYYPYDLAPTSGYDPTFATGNDPYTSPVGSFAANGYGLYDMAGNVWQWCWDWYGSYASGTQTDPRGPASGSSRVLRGGGWDGDANGCRTASRIIIIPTYNNYNVGFRSVLPPGQ